MRSLEDLTRDLSLHNDVLFSLLTVCQLVIDAAGELAARRGDRFDDYVGAVEAMNRLEPVKRFLTIVAGLEAADDAGHA